jgi:hypothetical protein
VACCVQSLQIDGSSDHDNHSNPKKGENPVAYRVSVIVLAFVSVAGYAQVPYRNNGSRFNRLIWSTRRGTFASRPARGTSARRSAWFTVLDRKGDEMHDPDESPGTAGHHRNTGKFADGTVLVEEVFGTIHRPMTTGDGHRGVRYPRCGSS